MDKRPSEEFTNVKTILLDVEGTTTSISFVKETLFPFVKENLKKYLEANWGKDHLLSDIKLLKEQSDRDKADAVEGHVAIEEGDAERESIVKNVEWQISQDRKNPALKQLQGHVWEEGYKSGVLVGHVYDDVADCLRDWVKSGRKVYIFSSGSVEAQKLLFENTVKGNLIEFISGHFDTNTGSKTESKSYASIAADVDVPADSILFLTDVVKEAEAARTAGLAAVLVEREGNAPLSDDEKSLFTTISSFKDLELEPCAKRARTEEAPVVDVVKAKEPTAETEGMDVDATEAKKDVAPDSTTATEKAQETDETEKTDTQCDNKEDKMEAETTEPEKAAETEKVVEESKDKETVTSTEEDAKKEEKEVAKDDESKMETEKAVKEGEEVTEKKDEAETVAEKKDEPVESSTQKAEEAKESAEVAAEEPKAEEKKPEEESPIDVVETAEEAKEVEPEAAAEEQPIKENGAAESPKAEVEKEKMESEDAVVAKETEETKEAKETNESVETKEAEVTKETKDSKEAEATNETKESNEAEKVSNETAETKKVEETKTIETDAVPAPEEKPEKQIETNGIQEEKPTSNGVASDDKEVASPEDSKSTKLNGDSDAPVVKTVPVAQIEPMEAAVAE